MTERFTRSTEVLISPPGGPAQTVVRAPPRSVLDSKRIPLMEAQEERLASELLVLDEGTRARNREFERRMDAVEERGGRWGKALAEEAEEMEKEGKELREAVAKMLDAAALHCETRIREDFDFFYREPIPARIVELQKVQDSFDEFVQVTVPKAIDETSGIISRKVAKARETFELENTKVMKREEKIVLRFEKHVGNVLQGFEDENATRVAKMHLLAEEVDRPERDEERLEEARFTKLMKEIVHIREMVKAEEKERAAEDGLVLDEMLRTQEKLQRSVLENFGAGDDSDGEY